MTSNIGYLGIQTSLALARLLYTVLWWRLLVALGKSHWSPMTLAVSVSIGMDVPLLGTARLGFIAVVLKHSLLQPLRRPGTRRVHPFHPRPRRCVCYNGEDNNAQYLVHGTILRTVCMWIVYGITSPGWVPAGAMVNEDGSPAGFSFCSTTAS